MFAQNLLRKDKYNTVFKIPLIFKLRPSNLCNIFLLEFYNTKNSVYADHF